MIPREVVRIVLSGGKPPYVPWSYKFTFEAEQELNRDFPLEDIQGE